EHAREPLVLAEALVNHVLAERPVAREVRVRPHVEMGVVEHRPHRQGLESLARVRVDEEPVVHQRVAAVAASITASGVSGLIEQSGPSARNRPPISAIARRPRASTSDGGRLAISGLAGRPPMTARPVRRCASFSDGVPDTVAQLRAAIGESTNSSKRIPAPQTWGTLHGAPSTAPRMRRAYAGWKRRHSATVESSCVTRLVA